MPSDLPHDLRRASKRLRALGTTAPAAARRALDRLDRDLLPRTAAGESGEPCLVAGIVGPNNSGKSALFNALVGAEISPSLSEAGATRRLLGAARPEVIARLRAEPSLAARFPIAAAEAGADLSAQAGRNADDPASLLLVPSATLPPSLVLIDTPDFDSIFGGNRRASEALLAVADLAVVVVTKHTYQNREVVEYLREWLAHGRPWLLVYNEAGPPEQAEKIAARHAERLATAVGTPPRATFWAPLDLDVQRGKPLETQALDGTSGGLRALLEGGAGAAELKAEAMRASLQQLRDDLFEVAETLAAGAHAAEEARAVAVRRADAAGRAAARAAWPLGAFAEAFRAVLDRRSAGFRRGLRSGVRGARLKAEGLVRRLRGKKPGSDAAPPLLQLEMAALRGAWPEFWEGTARDLGAERRLPAAAGLPAALRSTLDQELGPDQGTSARERAESVLLAAPIGLEEFQAHCEALVEAALDERGSDWDVQLFADLLLILPAAGAASLVVVTGGLGADAAVLGLGALGEMVVEKFLPKLVGSPILDKARRDWDDLRGGALAALLMEAALPRGGPALLAMAEQEGSAADELRSIAEGLA